EEAGVVGLDERVPVAPPDDLDDVPAGAAEGGLQLLNDLAVAAHRAVEPLQVAVDDEDQVVELLAGGEGDGAQGLRLVGLAVAQEGPDLPPLRIPQAAVAQVAVELRLIDGGDRPEAHRDGGELPEVGHQPRVGVGRESSLLHLAAERLHLIGGDAPLEEGMGVDAGGGVSLEVNHVPFEAALAAAAEEVVKADLVEG